MGVATLDIKEINKLRDLSDLIPVIRDSYQSWDIKVFDRSKNACKNYLSPNRREFYKILFINEGSGTFTIGLNTYPIHEPTILFIHPSDVISWKKLSENATGYYLVFRRNFIENSQSLKEIVNRYQFFKSKGKCVSKLNEHNIAVLNNHFEKLIAEDDESDIGKYKIQAIIQLILLDCIDLSNPVPSEIEVTNEYKHIYDFFELLEDGSSKILDKTVIKRKTAKEFAGHLGLHPNYLNLISKKYTGQSVSVHIRSRILEEAKVLLLQTNWKLEEIATSLGFSDQPNFSLFFKKNTGITPAEFRNLALNN